ncbi:hypothetical protein B0J18DRAFT_433424 [Chaetomium sp. MPI-SDFR-AT-0129]|nr:hypothetical protein B0J18DRAFT_433424 [Chaetomium sp. MPI-SDFR-AT-0129]
MIMASTDEINAARQLVEDIAEERGFLPEEIWEGMQPAKRARIKRSMANLQRQAASSVSTLAKNLYTSSARFIFELLQNCDDNSYNRAEARHEVPSVTFKVYHERIVLECNEDGFNKDNIVAISGTGQSSKKGHHGYVGAKGIGFKSVFKAARRVEIQSGPFTFFFEHKQGDTGLGMITPQWLNRDPIQADDLNPHLTRITLFLHDNEDQHQRQVILDQFRDLEQSILLFTRRVKRVEIQLYNTSPVNEAVLQKTTTFSAASHGPSQVILSKRVTENDNSTESTQIYHITRHAIHNLARHDDREYSQEDADEQVYATSEIVLGFPLSEGSIPVIKPQEVFAFLPMRDMGFSFLIQADFVTQANRQDIVESSARNAGILRGIADAFRATVVRFCQNPSLRYTWMRFVPRPERHHYVGYWKELVSQIRNNVSAASVLRGMYTDELLAFPVVRQLEDRLRDKDNEPLFSDRQGSRYLSGLYDDEACEILREMGMPRFETSDVLDLVEFDLAQEKPRMHSKLRDIRYIRCKDWYSRVAKLLTGIITETSNLRTNKRRSNEAIVIMSRVKALRVIPVARNSWATSAQTNQAPIFLPTTGGVDIPRNVGLRLLEDWAFGIAPYRVMCEHLGVSEATPQHVRSTIFSHSYGVRGVAQTVSLWVKELVFIYRTDHLVTPYDKLNGVKVVTEAPVVSEPQYNPIYLPGHNDGYSPRELLEAQPASSNGTLNAVLGFPDARFIHWHYLEETPSNPTKDSPSWEKWLVSKCWIQPQVPILRAGALSDAFNYVAAHKKGKIMGLLCRRWPVEGATIRSANLCSKLKEITVPLEAGAIQPGSTIQAPLASTYLPLPKLKTECARFLGRNSLYNFPFLKLDEPIEDANYGKDWRFATEFLGVGHLVDIPFFLRVLQVLRLTQLLRGNEPELSESETRRSLEIYQAIYVEYQKSTIKLIHAEEIKKEMASNPGIMVPLWTGESTRSGTSCRCIWATASQCVWKGPHGLYYKKSLTHHFKSFFEPSEIDVLRPLFCDIAGVRDCDGDDIVRALVRQRDNPPDGSADIDAIRGLYEYLSGIVKSSRPDSIRAKFHEQKLIYDPDSETWHLVSESIWSADIKIQGKASLSEEYDNLREFFVEFLGVPTPTFKLLYDEVLNLGKPASGTNPETMKEKLQELASLLPMANREDPSKLLKLVIFPVRNPNGEVRLVDGSTSFGIIDTQPLEEKFGHRCKVLNYDFEDFLRLKELWRWLGLTNKYLSNMVKEITSVDESDKMLIAPSKLSMASKAHGLYRVAAQFSSPRIPRANHPGLYETLATAQVYTSNKIFAQLSITMDGKPVTEEYSTVHINDRDGKMQIFLPRRRKEQEFCLSSGLPKQLFEYLMQHPDSNGLNSDVQTRREGVEFTRLVLTTSHTAMKDVLAEHGLADVGLEDTYVDEDDHSDDDNTTNNESSRSSVDNARVPDDSTSSNRGVYGQADARTPGYGQHRPDHPDTPASSQSDGGTPSEYSHHDATLVVRGAPLRVIPGEERDTARVHAYGPNPGYRNLLLRATSAASELGDIPREGTTTSAAPTPIHAAREIGMWASGLQRYQRDEMVGAAGELFVFKFLGSPAQNLEGFTIESWQSTIRDLVSSHPEYTDIREWPGRRETSDFVYDDVRGVLTSKLASLGYLSPTDWQGRHPKYFIEVKSTTGELNTPFYMSRSQYRRMENLRNSQNEIYVIFRVYGLEKDEIGLKVYVNPWLAKESGDLVFVSDSWTVAPPSA